VPTLLLYQDGILLFNQAGNFDEPRLEDIIRENGGFRMLWLGQVVSLFGDWFNLLASAALIATLTESGFAVGGLFMVRMLAPFVGSSFRAQ